MFIWASMPATIARLDPPIPVTTPKGDARAHLYIDYGRDDYGSWVCFLIDSGESWTFIDPDIRLWEVPTDGRNSTSPFRKVKK